MSTFSPTVELEISQIRKCRSDTSMEDPTFHSRAFTVCKVIENSGWVPQGTAPRVGSYLCVQTMGKLMTQMSYNNLVQYLEDLLIVSKTFLSMGF